MIRNFLISLAFIVITTAAIGTGIRPLISFSAIGVIIFYGLFWVEVDLNCMIEDLKKENQLYRKRKEIENLGTNIEV